MVTYRLTEPRDIPQLVELVNAQYARKKTPAYFTWQFFESYYETICMGAFDHDALVGMFGLQRRMLTNGLVMGHLIDLLVDPRWRGKGVFSELADRSLSHFKDLRAFSVLPNGYGKAACERLGFRTIAKIDDLVLVKKKYLVPKEIPVLPMPSLAYAANDAYRVWRFEKNPTYRYETVQDNVTKIFTDPVTGEKFGDIVAYQKNPMPAVDSFFDRNIEQISTWALPHSPLFPFLQQTGFVPLQRERYFCIKTLDQNLDSLYDITHWRLVPADAELY